MSTKKKSKYRVPRVVKYLEKNTKHQTPQPFFAAKVIANYCREKTHQQTFIFGRIFRPLTKIFLKDISR